MGKTDIKAATDYINTMPFDTEQERQDLIMNARSDYAATHGMPKADVLQPGYVDPNLQRFSQQLPQQVESAYQQANQDWATRAAQEARTGVTIQPAIAPVRVTPDTYGIGRTDALGTARIMANEQSNQLNARLKQETDQRKQQWDELVERARNTSVQRQRVARI